MEELENSRTWQPASASQASQQENTHDEEPSQCKSFGFWQARRGMR